MRLAVVIAAACSNAASPASWLFDENAAFARARAEHRDVMIEFTADWSVPSQQLSRTIDAMLPELAARLVPLRIDATNNTDDVERVRSRYGADTLPQIVVVAPDGKVHTRVTRVLGEADLRATLR